jgi:actin-related protein
MGDKMNTIVIDYGSENIKAGYDWSQEGPELVFRPQISKNRDASKADLPIKTYINTSYDQLDLTKTNYKSPY